MVLSYPTVKARVHRVVRAETVRAMVNFSAQEPRPNLWGINLNDDRNIMKTIYLMLYKGIVNIGYDKLTDEVNNWYHPGHNSLEHNVHVIRKDLMAWSKHQINIGTYDGWETSAIEINYQNGTLRIHLRCDSVDFRLKGIMNSISYLEFYYFRSS